jgi:2-dehydro-3-deoxyphosphogluconate aldolase/(4S)-4-hydroxy-2-oxoglutarate aldolase
MAYHVFTKAISHVLNKNIDVILGIGSICDAPTAALYIANGANFVVGPLLNKEVARLCNRRKIAYSPGCGSVSEIGKAEELGVEIVKVFPGTEVGGPAFVKSVMGPCPWTRIMPTGGVDATKESLTSWIHSGVAAVGAGSKLITKDLVDAEDWDGLTKKIAQSVTWVKEIREDMK